MTSTGSYLSVIAARAAGRVPSLAPPRELFRPPAPGPADLAGDGFGPPPPARRGPAPASEPPGVSPDAPVRPPTDRNDVAPGGQAAGAAAVRRPVVPAERLAGVTEIERADDPAPAGPARRLAPARGGPPPASVDPRPVMAERVGPIQSAAGSASASSARPTAQPRPPARGTTDPEAVPPLGGAAAVRPAVARGADEVANGRAAGGVSADRPPRSNGLAPPPASPAPPAVPVVARMAAVPHESRADAARDDRPRVSIGAIEVRVVWPPAAAPAPRPPAAARPAGPLACGFGAFGLVQG